MGPLSRDYNTHVHAYFYYIKSILLCINIIQIGLLGLQVIWTMAATEALKNARSDKKIMQVTDNHFQEILDMLIDVTTKELTKIERTKFETLITIHLHQRDIFHALVKI